MLTILLTLATLHADSFENCRLTVNTVHDGVTTETHSAALQKIGIENGVVTYRTFVSGRYGFLVHGSGAPLGSLEQAPIARDVVRRSFISGSLYEAGIVDAQGEGRRSDLRPEAIRFRDFLIEKPNSDPSMYRFLVKDGPVTLARWHEAPAWLRANLDPVSANEGQNAALTCD